jgi:hypothetical protein
MRVPFANFRRTVDELRPENGRLDEIHAALPKVRLVHLGGGYARALPAADSRPSAVRAARKRPRLLGESGAPLEHFVSLPIYTELTDAEGEHVAAAAREAARGQRVARVVAS